VLLTLAYDGARFAGFAPQKNASTVAQALGEAIRRLDPGASALRVASRTDSGVHARGQVASFDSTRVIASRGWLLGLTAFLPPEIAIQRVAEVPVGFNPSKDAIGKIYRYTILCGSLRDPFLVGRSWRVHERLDVTRMSEEAQALLGTHDFFAFRGAADFRVDTVRRIDRAVFSQPESAPRCLVFEIEGNRFLYRMVRIIVGTLVDVGRGYREPGAIARAIISRDREHLGVTAPPDGLCLERVQLRDEGSAGWPDHLRS
jgi:tRNA pseudouridine38-40 synthase